MENTYTHLNNAERFLLKILRDLEEQKKNGNNK